MKILVTGASGFVGQNLTEQLKNIRDGKAKNTPLDGEPLEIMMPTPRSDAAVLAACCRQADAVVHLAGVNRADHFNKFVTGNVGFTKQLLADLKQNPKKPTVIFASSIHAGKDTPYGRTKKEAEDLIFAYGEETGARTVVYRFTNLFGKWCRPDYNSVTATFCRNIAADLPIRIDDRQTALTLTYIDDVVEELLRALAGHAQTQDGYGCVKETTRITLGELADLLQRFRAAQKAGELPCLRSAFEQKLYATYLTYLPDADLRQALQPKADERGSFTELLHIQNGGQISVNISRPGVTKGQHWHHSKHERFIVVKGHGLIQTRRIGTDAAGQPYPIRSYEVRGEKPEVITMVPGCTHNLINLSEQEEMITIIWANEAFDPEHPDTYREPVSIRRNV